MDFGPTITSLFETMSRRVVGQMCRCESRTFICASSAETKTSPGAPFSICLTIVLDPAKLNVTAMPVVRVNAAPISRITSVSDAAA